MGDSQSDVSTHQVAAFNSNSTMEVSGACGASKLSQKEHIFASVGFFLIGVMVLLPFQFILVLQPPLVEHFAGNRDVGNSLLGLYNITSILVSLLMLKIGSLHTWLIKFGLIISIVCLAAYGPVFFYGSTTCTLWLAHIIMGLLGMSNGVIQGSGFSYAAIMPVNYVGTTSVGIAGAGLLSYALTSSLIGHAFDMTVSDEVVTFTSICCGFCIAVTIASFVYVHILFNWSVTRRAELEAKQGNNTDLENPKKNTEGLEAQDGSGISTSQLPPRPWREMMKGSFWPLFTVFWCFFVSFSLFPKVGPLGFNFSDKDASSIANLFGLYFVGDFCGRLSLKLPNIHRVFGFLNLSLRGSVVMALLRTLLFVPFFLAMKLENVPVINTMAFCMILMFIMAFTLGWVGTWGLIHCSLSVRGSEKGRIGALSTISLLSGIAVGLYAFLPL